MKDKTTKYIGGFYTWHDLYTFRQALINKEKEPPNTITTTHFANVIHFSGSYILVHGWAEAYQKYYWHETSASMNDPVIPWQDYLEELDEILGTNHSQERASDACSSGHNWHDVLLFTHYATECKRCGLLKPEEL